MFGYFSFEVRPRDLSCRHLVLFCATAKPTADDVVSVVRRHGESAISPDSVILLGFDSEKQRIEEIAADQRVNDCIPYHTRHVSAPVIKPVMIPRTGLQVDERVGDVCWHDIAQAGLRAIFTSRNALLVAPPTHHFEKPSKRHCDRFIRAANALVDGAEIVFIAANCLRYVPDSVRHYYCDTGGIGVLAFAIDSLRRRFDHDATAATVNTFESYGGLQRFQFRECDSSIVLVSASTSGGLEKEICQREQRFRPNQIVTVFSIGQRKHESNVILDLEEDAQHRSAIGEFTSFAEADCPLCHQHGSIAVPMAGDQFIPVRSETRSIVMTVNDAPGWLMRFLGVMAAKRLLKSFYRSPNTYHAANDVFVDLESLFFNWNPADLMPQRITRLFNQSIPAATRRVIHLDDPASRLLGELFATELRKLHRDQERVTVISAKNAIDAEQFDDGATAVVAAAVASGQSLIAISQLLRRLQSNGAISYFVALARMPNTADFEKLERDLRMGEQPSDYGFCFAERINLPVVGRNAECAWDEELELLQELSDASNGLGLALLEQRIAVLRNAQSSAERGLVDQLFWPNISSQELRLTPGFVFFRNTALADKAADVSQGDVYFTIVSVLHHMRFGNGAKSNLRQTEYERRVLSPLCFDRFNDGVIQAALLRAALRPELDYSASAEESQRMAAVIRSILASTSSAKGDASREFLLAMALGRLALLRMDIQKLFDDFANSESDPISRVFWARIKNLNALKGEFDGKQT